MPLAAKLNTSDVIIDRFITPLIPGTFVTKAISQVNGKPYLLPIERVDFTPFDSATQKRSGPVDDVQPAKVVETYTVVDKTVQELDDEKTVRANSDLDILISKAIAAEVLVRDKEIVQKVNEIITEAGLTAAPIATLSAAEWKTRLRDRYKSFL